MILLDTHVLLLWLAAERLAEQASALLADRRQRVGVSSVAVFEIETKRRLGKLRAPMDVVGAVERSGFEHVVLEPKEAELAGRLDWEHRDPFDRLLVAQSRIRACPLVTADARILTFEPSAIGAR